MHGLLLQSLTCSFLSMEGELTHIQGLFYTPLEQVFH